MIKDIASAFLHRCVIYNIIPAEELQSNLTKVYAFCDKVKPPIEILNLNITHNKFLSNVIINHQNNLSLCVFLNETILFHLTVKPSCGTTYGFYLTYDEQRYPIEVSRSLYEYTNFLKNKPQMSATITESKLYLLMINLFAIFKPELGLAIELKTSRLQLKQLERMIETCGVYFSIC